MAIDPAQDKIDALLDLPDGQPVIMMNLLRFTDGGVLLAGGYRRGDTPEGISCSRRLRLHPRTSFRARRPPRPGRK
jgi:hypothetical protein